MIRFASFGSEAIAYSAMDYINAFGSSIGDTSFEGLNSRFFKSFNYDTQYHPGAIMGILSTIVNAFDMLPWKYSSWDPPHPLDVGWQLISDAYAPLFELLSLGFFGGMPTTIYPLCFVNIDGETFIANESRYCIPDGVSNLVFTTNGDKALELGFSKDENGIGIFKRYVSSQIVERYWFRQKFILIDGKEVSIYAETERGYLVECAQDGEVSPWLANWNRMGIREPAPTYMKHFPKGDGIKEWIIENDIHGDDVWDQDNEFFKPWPTC